MLPSVLAEQIQQGVKDFLRTTFPVATPAFKGLIDSITENFIRVCEARPGAL